MPVSECASRSGFQIPFESDRSFLVRKLHNDVNTPGTTRCGVRAAAGIVGLESGCNVGRQACVVTIRIGLASNDVDESLHGAQRANQEPRGNQAESSDLGLREIGCVTTAVVASRGGLRLHEGWLANRSSVRRAATSTFALRATVDNLREDGMSGGWWT